MLCSITNVKVFDKTKGDFSMEEKGKKASKMMNQEQIFKIMLSMTFIVSAVFFLKIFFRRHGAEHLR